MELAMPGNQPDSPRTRTERYLRLVRPGARGCWGIVAAVAVFSAAGAADGRGGLALASGYLAFLGSYCLLNLRECRETHCAITGPGWTIAALLGFAAVLTPGSEWAWCRGSGERLPGVAICIPGYGMAA